MHAAGEYTWLPSGAFDLVSLSLVCHELPRSATKEVYGEILLICALRSLYSYLYWTCMEEGLRFRSFEYHNATNVGSLYAWFYIFKFFLSPNFWGASSKVTFTWVQIIEEAHRLLKPGGALAIMEMNPYSPLVQNMINNIFAFTAVSWNCPLHLFSMLKCVIGRDGQILWTYVEKNLSLKTRVDGEWKPWQESTLCQDPICCGTSRIMVLNL